LFNRDYVVYACLISKDIIPGVFLVP